MKQPKQPSQYQSWLSAILVAAQPTVFFLLAILLPHGAFAKTQTLLGSLTITSASPTDRVGVTVLHNPGTDETISQQLLPLTVPVFVDVDKEDSGGRVVNKRFDALVALTNVSSAVLNDIKVTLMDASRTTMLASKTISLGPYATALVFASDLLS